MGLKPKNTTPEKPSQKMTHDSDAYLKELAVDVLARTLWGEARGERPEGRIAVACVILNRLAISNRRGSHWWGNSIIDICQKPYQFSCWNADDPNRPKLMAVDRRNPVFVSCLRVARRAVYLGLDDTTNGATHYHAAGMTPFWVKNERPVAVIGNHIFYRLED